ncbi:uncharacterized protein LOC110851135 isoform X2 [Folsomia candida]|uniref:Zinc finger protein klf1 n=1 Tax=Folsomia candida TaxID=158441 RepID=A0A226E8G0_FOLCA|nr:uncharacterized protein LOC110851135 isoform X2 [Folsomia candida]OXA53307.1 Zinc finger protein klf1 [Folsomia candida]
MPPKLIKRESGSDDETDHDSSDNYDTPTKRARLSSSKEFNSSGYETESTPRRVTRSLQIGGGTSSAAAKRELRGAFGDHDDDDDNNSVGESTDDDDDDNLEDPDENIDDEVDLRDWKLDQVDSAVKKLQTRMDNIKGGYRLIGIAHVETFMNEYKNAKDATDVVSEMSINDYFVTLPPPTDNQEYINAVANLEKQSKARKNSNVKLKCPLQPCKTTFARMDHAKRHVLAKHLKIKLFCCKKCPLTPWKDHANMKRHVISKHFDLKYTCPTCLMLFSRNRNVHKHASLRHVTPTGKLVFLSPSKRKIDMKLFQPEYITVKYGCTYQLYVIPWVDKNGKLVDISICFTKFGDIKEVARKLWDDIVRACEKIANQGDNADEPQNESWVEMCGSARAERAKGHEMRPDLAFPLGVYGVSLIVACQLKWFARLYFDAVKVLATGDSKYFV